MKREGPPPEILAEARALAERLAEGVARFDAVGDDDVAIATTPKDRVFEQDKVTLYRYRPLGPSDNGGAPLVLCYGLIGRWTVLDLQPDRSLVRELLNRGVDLWLVDWGEPDRAERFLTLDDYVDGYLRDCIEAVLRATGRTQVDLLGVCEGGVLATCFTALHRDAVNALVLAITPIDFHADAVGTTADGRGYLNLWARNLPPEEIDRLVEAYGVLPGDLLASVFSRLTPTKTITKHGLDLLDLLADEARFLTFLRMERWLSDRPHHPGEAAKQWLKELYGENRLVRNEFSLGGRRVDLRAITCPVLNVIAMQDTIVPPATSRALCDAVGTTDYTELPLPGGHIGVFVGGKSHRLLGPAIADWLLSRRSGALA